MTTVYFVRHAQPVFRHTDDRTRPLTAEGLADRALVLDTLRDVRVDAFYSSPYRRTYDTVAPAAAWFGLPIYTDERFREREAGEGGNGAAMFRARWADFGFHEPGGESLGDVQKRNIAALNDVLDANAGRTVVIGTHGTALSTILNYYDPTFGCDSFLRIIDWMPYVVEMTFDGRARVGMREVAHIHKEFVP